MKDSDAVYFDVTKYNNDVLEAVQDDIEIELERRHRRKYKQPEQHKAEYNFQGFLDERLLTAKFEKNTPKDELKNVYESDSPLEVAFDWDYTKEGYLFWEDVLYDWNKVKEAFRCDAKFSHKITTDLQLKIILDVLTELDIDYKVVQAINHFCDTETIGSKDKMNAKDIKEVFFGHLYR